MGLLEGRRSTRSKHSQASNLVRSLEIEVFAGVHIEKASGLRDLVLLTVPQIADSGHTLHRVLRIAELAVDHAGRPHKASFASRALPAAPGFNAALVRRETKKVSSGHRREDIGQVVDLAGQAAVSDEGLGPRLNLSQGHIEPMAGVIVLDEGAADSAGLPVFRQVEIAEKREALAHRPPYKQRYISHAIEFIGHGSTGVDGEVGLKVDRHEFATGNAG